MNETVVRGIGAVAIFVGETLAIYQEMLAARAARSNGLTLASGAWMVGWMTLAGLLLLLGYYAGYLSFRNIWVVTVLSIGAILIAEPLLILSFFNELPTTGQWIGLVLAVLGIIASLLL